MHISKDKNVLRRKQNNENENKLNFQTKEELKNKKLAFK